jgi:hypothetical protein
VAAAAAQMNRGGSLVRRVGTSFKNPVTLEITFPQIVDSNRFLLEKISVDRLVWQL